MSTSQWPRFRGMVWAVLLAGSLATAAFAFNATVYAKDDTCCLSLGSQCFGNLCEDSDNCQNGQGVCCDRCGI